MCSGAAYACSSLNKEGRPLRQQSSRYCIEMIAEARGRLERAFGTHSGRLPQELEFAGIADMESATRYVSGH